MTPNRITVTLLQGDDPARLRDLEASAEALAPAPGGERSPEFVAALAECDEFVRGEADGRALKVTVEALPRKKWRDLVTRFPAREDDEQDQAVGFNVDDGADLLVEWAVVDVVDAGKKITAQKRQGVVDALSDGQFFKVLSAAIKANLEGTEAPKADLSSRVTQIYDAMLQSRGDSA